MNITKVDTDKQKTALEAAEKWLRAAVSDGDEHSIAYTCERYLDVYNKGLMAFVVSDVNGIVHKYKQRTLPKMEMQETTAGFLLCYRFEKEDAWYSTSSYTVTLENNKEKQNDEKKT